MSLLRCLAGAWTGVAAGRARMPSGLRRAVLKPGAWRVPASLDLDGAAPLQFRPVIDTAERHEVP